MNNENIRSLRALVGGAEIDGRHYLGGEFLPFYIPRPEMPQIDEIKQPELVRDALDAIGVGGVTFEVVPITSLIAHQHVNKKMADAMTPEHRAKPIIISGDNYILDGNHRWWAHVHQHEPLINVIRLGRTFDFAIPWLLTLPYVYKLTPETPIRS